MFKTTVLNSRESKYSKRALQTVRCLRLKTNFQNSKITHIFFLYIYYESLTPFLPSPPMLPIIRIFIFRCCQTSQIFVLICQVKGWLGLLLDIFPLNLLINTLYTSLPFVRFTRLIRSNLLVFMQFCMFGLLKMYLISLSFFNFITFRLQI